jgi:FkbM family methyltransferase
VNVASIQTASTGTRKLAPFLNDIEPFFYNRPIIYADIGAHRGDMFREVLLSGLNINRAYLIEPNPKSFVLLRQAVADLEATELASCYPLAISDRPGQLTLRAADSMTKVVGIEHTDDPAEQIFTVEARTLDA